MALEEMLHYIANPLFLWEMITGLAALGSALSHIKMKIPASLDMSPTHIEELSSRFEGYKSVRLKMVQMPTEGV